MVAEQSRKEIVELEKWAASEGDRVQSRVRVRARCPAVVGEKRIGGRLRQRQGPEGAVPLQEVPGQFDDIIPAVAESGHLNVHPVQPSSRGRGGTGPVRRAARVGNSKRR
jgi:hypothetical protein